MSNRTGAFLVGLLFCARAATAQDVGKIQGRVVSNEGVPLPSVQIVVVGTAFGNLSNADGFYFVNNVPAGLQDVRAVLIGYQAVVVRAKRVLAGQTTTVDFQLTSAPIEIEPLEIVGEIHPLMPRDQVGSKSIVPGDVIDDLPVDNVNGLVALQPGVVSDGPKGISIRGGRSGEEAVFVDGVLIRNFIGGRSRLALGTNSLSELDVITGGFSAEFGEAQSGILNFVTRTGARRWTGTFEFQTDDVFPKPWSNGLNRAELAFGGPVMRNLGVFFAGTATGQRYSNGGRAWRDVPIYVQQGIDTVITCSTDTCLGDGGAGAREIVIPAFVRFDEGGRYPFSGSDEYTLDGKVDYSYGEGSRAFVTHKRSRNQQLVAPRQQIYNISNRIGTVARSTATILSWTHNIIHSPERALSFDFKAAFTSDWSLRNNLSPEFARSSLKRPFGFSFDTYDLLFDKEDLDLAEKLEAFRHNDLDGVTPFNNQIRLRNVLEYRMNPYGIKSYFSTRGIEGDFTGLAFAEERQAQARLAIDWQINRHHRLKAGGDYFDIEAAQLFTQYVNSTGADVWVEHPMRAGMFVQDRLDVGDLVVELGLRYDRFDPRSYFPVVPGYYDVDDPATVQKAPARHSLSPRLGVAFPVTVSSTVRLSYGHFTQVPDLDDYFQGKNKNYFLYGNTAANAFFARPLDLPKTISFEFGYRQLLSDDFVIDFAVFNRQKLRDVSVRKTKWDNPVNPGDSTFLNTYTNADFGVIRGFDVRIDRRWQGFNAMFGYSYQDARNTGTDPFSALASSDRLTGNAMILLGLPPAPSEQVRVTEENRKHNFSASLAWHAPGAITNPILRGLGVFATAHVVSGFSYTRNTEDEELAEGELLTGTMPWQRHADLRLVRSVSVMGSSVRLVLDAHNIFDLENRVTVDAVTDGITRDYEVDKLVQSHRAVLGSGTLRDVIDLRSLAAAGTGVTNEIDLHLLRRAEQRFGDGNLLFSAAEQDRAFRAAENFIQGPQDRVGPGRRVRLGLEFTF